ncbi:hypothetical protein Vretimale_19675 [Volvox reticuliferus]|uniref:Uncharacterized protein n=1 Tax=Volvox reticuliferus TaxID=1737510 RepID=A0A8J4G1W3_9CHLO|nr:hypothetical protein Vretifemale_20680 [Volvox reticuliferus]GIM17158.1 hypothetical protein Vretimale_19675 [Volvox reticuliferus]
MTIIINEASSSASSSGTTTIFDIRPAPATKELLALNVREAPPMPAPAPATLQLLLLLGGGTVGALGTLGDPSGGKVVAVGLKDTARRSVRPRLLLALGHRAGFTFETAGGGTGMARAP